MSTAREFLFALPERSSSQDLDSGHDTSFNFILSGEGGGNFSVQIVDGQVRVREDLMENAECEVKATSDTFMQVINKELNPMMALLTGKIKIKNQKELLKYAKILGLG